MAATAIPGNKTLPFELLILLLLVLAAPSFADPRATEAALICGVRRAGDAVSFVRNFVDDMSALAELVSSNGGWGTHLANSSGNSSSSSPASTPVYGLAQCHSDLSPTDCLLCFSECRTVLPRCLPNVSARVFLDGCFLRYDSYKFYSESVDPDFDRALCGAERAGRGRGSMEEDSWRSSVIKLLGNLTEAAARSGGFAVSENGVVEGVYGLAECWKTVGSAGCRSCLEKAEKEVERCLPATEGRGLNAGCYLRYSDHKFYDDGAGTRRRNNAGGGSNSRKVLVLAILVPSAALSTICIWIYCAKRRNKKGEGKQPAFEVYAHLCKSLLYFKYETLEKATSQFSPTNKLGQGGVGSVYKGTLPDGTNIAVKRLSFDRCRQWAEEFFNEVNLISGLHHKNLVKLLGCSIEGPQSLLVYEYVPNKSLDHFITGKGNTQLLTWRQRFQIIVDVAEGLAYLHQGRIIHRDVKCSNVLLDEHLSARIADFGLARRFAVDQTHLITGVAGTPGYLAPEYIVSGLLTDKADVYSFGVLALEIISGRLNNMLMHAHQSGAGSLLLTAWKSYTSGTAVELLDERLKEEIENPKAGEQEVTYLLQVGLLCAQASASLRPSMVEVVQMLAAMPANISTIPEPQQPPFADAGFAQST